jgi:hypothetical protein
MEIDPVLRFVVIEIDGQRVGVAAIAYDGERAPLFGFKKAYALLL